jgi:hypothetical protein
MPADYLGDTLDFDYQVSTDTVLFFEAEIVIGDSFDGSDFPGPYLLRRHGESSVDGPYHRYIYATEEVTITGQTFQAHSGTGRLALP